MKTQKKLIGISKELDKIIFDLAFLTSRYSYMHQGNAGNLSQVISKETGKQILKLYEKDASKWYPIDKLEQLVEIRNDGRKSYKPAVTSNKAFYDYVAPLKGRMMIITTTSSDLSSMNFNVNMGEEGKILNTIEIDKTGTKLRILYGNKQYGTIPTSELATHLASNAMSIAEGVENPATLHTHQSNVLMLARDNWVRGDYTKFNAAIYPQNHALHGSHPHLVGIIPYHNAGTEAIIINSLEPLKENRFIVWMNHGVIYRTDEFMKGYSRMSSAEDAAKGALDTLRFNSAMLLPEEYIAPFLKEKNLMSAYNQLLKKISS